MAEAVIRQHKRRVDRWMPGERQGFITKAAMTKGVQMLSKVLPGYLLSFTDVLGIPSGFQAAFAAALAATGRDARPTLVGAAAAMIVRWLSGIAPHWEMALTLAALTAAPLMLHGRGTRRLMGMTALVMLPTAIAATLSPTAAEMLQGWASLLLAALSAPVMARALRTIDCGRHIGTMEEQISVGFLLIMLLCGGARMLFLGVNIGVLLSAWGTLCIAAVLGVGAGVLGGMLSGVALALQGVSLTVSVALAMGGFLAGVAQSLGKRRVTCGAFAMGAYLPLILCGVQGFGCGTAVLLATLTAVLMPRSMYERVKDALRRFLPNDPAPGDAYAASALSAWEQTVAAMARAVPSPKDADQNRDGAWWAAHLCQGCPECADCGCLTTELGVAKAEQVWRYRHAAAEIWQDALENLRGMGCQRLYFLREAMIALRREDEAAQRVARQAEAQREMLVTHLTAMSGAARRFAMLSSGDSWWDMAAARRIRRELAERAMPVTLSYVRRVQGHAQAAFELQFITGARSQAEELKLLTSALLDVPMQLASLDGERVILVEQPLLFAEAGAAAAAISGGDICGDTTWTGLLSDGRFLAVLADGMGHGEHAALISRQTVELLRLCLDAGYTRQQALTAVNGMLLLGGSGERFAAADMLTIDLWKGHAALDKLGMPPSWLWRQGNLTRLNGDGLPLGILDEVDESDTSLKLCPGDALVLLSDGVEDAFADPLALETAVTAALTCDMPAEAAQQLLDAAIAADDDCRRDDQSALVVFIRRTERHEFS